MTRPDHPLYGAFIGDIFGSAYEFSSSPENKLPSLSATDFDFRNSDYTDDSVRTGAILSSLRHKQSAAEERRRFAKEYPPRKGGFGLRFSSWLSDPKRKAYHSFGNGAGRRISPVPYFSSTLFDCDSLAVKITALTHDHKEGIKAGAVIADLIYLALNGYRKEDREKFALLFYPDCLSFNFTFLHLFYSYNAKAAGSVPQALFCFFKTNNFLSCLKAVCYIGGDADTIGARSLAIALAYYQKVPDNILSFTKTKLPLSFVERIEKAPLPQKNKSTPVYKEEERKKLPSYILTR